MATKRVRSALPGNPGTLRAELTLQVTDGILSEVENRTPRSVRRLHGHRPLIPTVERRSGSGHLSPAQGVRPSGWRCVASQYAVECQSSYERGAARIIPLLASVSSCVTVTCLNGTCGLAPPCVATEGRQAMDSDSPGRSWPSSLLSHSVSAHAMAQEGLSR